VFDDDIYFLKYHTFMCFALSTRSRILIFFGYRCYSNFHSVRAIIILIQTFELTV
jgi:hypothetical protein